MNGMTREEVIEKGKELLFRNNGIMASIEAGQYTGDKDKLILNQCKLIKQLLTVAINEAEGKH